MDRVRKVGKRLREHAKTAGKVGVSVGKEVGRVVVNHAIERGKEAAIHHLKGKVDSYMKEQPKAPQFHRNGSVDKKYRPSL